jgi:hypothetical protein
LQEIPYAVWHLASPQKDSGLISGKETFFHDKTGKFNCGNSRGSEGQQRSGNLVDEAYQGMIIP